MPVNITIKQPVRSEILDALDVIVENARVIGIIGERLGQEVFRPKAISYRPLFSEIFMLGEPRKVATNSLAGVIVDQLLWRTDLLNLAFRHDNNAIAEAPWLRFGRA